VGTFEGIDVDDANKATDPPAEDLDRPATVGDLQRLFGAGWPNKYEILIAIREGVRDSVGPAVREQQMRARG
jgi:hypothetical protein